MKIRDSLFGWFALGVLGLAVAAPSAHAWQVFPNIAYPSPGCQQGRNRIDVYRPSNGPASGPTILLLNGGGFTSEDKSGVADMGRSLADAGYNCVAVNYSLTSSGYASFPQAPTDVLNVVRWVRTDGQGLGLDDSIVIFGVSSGAVVGMTATAGASNPMFINQPALPGRGLRVDGMIGISGRYDFLWNATTGIVPNYIEWYVGTPVGHPGWQVAFGSASAISHVDSCTPPTALYAPNNDGVVPSNNSVRLYNTLQAAGVPSWLTLPPGSGHGLNAAGDAVAIVLSELPRVIATGRGTCGRNGNPFTVGACCTQNVCSLTLQPQCTGQFTSWNGSATCEPSLCDNQSPTAGGCCCGSICVVIEPSECTGTNYQFLGIGIACNANNDFARPCCAADFDKSSDISIDDLFIYLNSWFRSNRLCATSSNGAGQPTIDDLFFYLNLWFTGC